MEYRTIGHLFGISRGSVCCIVHEVRETLVEVLMPSTSSGLKEENLKKSSKFFETSGVTLNVVVR